MKAPVAKRPSRPLAAHRRWSATEGEVSSRPVCMTLTAPWQLGLPTAGPLNP